jgi:hypothetical protein
MVIGEDLEQNGLGVIPVFASMSGEKPWKTSG